MKYLKTSITVSVLLLSSFVLYAQEFVDMKYGTDTTLEVASWNIETFPKNGTNTVDYVKEIIDSLDIDILAIQEVSDTNQFKQMVSELDGYVGYFQSSWFAGLAYIYKPDVIQVNDIYEIYTTSPYWDEFPRSPMVMDLTYNDERIIIMNNHLKCCGDEIMDISNNDDEETRRYHACILLKAYIDVYFPDEKVIVLGDLNDELTDIQANNVFQTILDDDDNYFFADLDIANGDSEGWSYPSWPSHLDHILITDNLLNDFSDPASSIDVIRVDEYMAGGWYNYEWYVSDHRPVAIKLNVTKGSNVDNSNYNSLKLNSYPNPFTNKINIVIAQDLGEAQLVIYNQYGQEILIHNYLENKLIFEWECEDLPCGIYYAFVIKDSQKIANCKLVKI